MLVRTYVNRTKKAVKFEIGDYEFDGPADEVKAVGDALLKAVGLANGEEPQTENQLARLSHEDAVHAALQSIADDAVVLTEHGAWQEHGDTASVLLGRLQDLLTSIEAWRALGGQTTDEAQDALDLLYGKGTGFR